MYGPIEIKFHIHAFLTNKMFKILCLLEKYDAGTSMATGTNETKITLSHIIKTLIFGFSNNLFDKILTNFFKFISYFCRICKTNVK